MGFDLVPQNPELEKFYFGAFSWPWLLDAGVGLVIGCGPALTDFKYYYKYDESQGQAAPKESDGYQISETDAKIMAQIASNLVWLERERRKEFEALTKEEQDQRMAETAPAKRHRVPVRDDFIDKAEKFAEWAAKSGGFKVC